MSVYTLKFRHPQSIQSSEPEESTQGQQATRRPDVKAA